MDRLGHAELQVAGFVAAEGQTSQVVTLDQQPTDAQLTRQARGIVQRGW